MGSLSIYRPGHLSWIMKLFVKVCLLVLCVTMSEATHGDIQGQHDHTQHSLPCGQGTGVLACRGGRECVARDKVSQIYSYMHVWGMHDITKVLLKWVKDFKCSIHYE